MSKLNFIATTAFGLEATVKREVLALGFEDVAVLDGRVCFSGGEGAIPRANLWLRGADRVLLVMGEFKALTFEELFEGTKALPWDEWIPADGKFTVTGKSVRSKLFSVPDCQSIVKKAVVEKLKQKYKTDWFCETGAEYKIQVSLLKDMAALTIDTTGSGLHKRGYREEAGAAPIKETLAFGLIELSYWRRDRTLLDPLCGSGTIPIEAALIAKNIAPGLNRGFASEKWGRVPEALWKAARREAYSLMDVNARPEIYGSDIDEKAIALAKRNARLAGVDDCVRFETRAFKDISALPAEYGVMIANPPYAERLGESGGVSELYRDMGRLMRGNKNWSVYLITSAEDFEKLYGRKADARRKLFTGMIKTDYYQYFGAIPPRGV